MTGENFWLIMKVSIVLVSVVLLILFVRAIFTKNIGLAFLWFSTGVNIVVLPLSLLIGVMATGSSDSGFIDLILGFLFVQTLPLILFISSLVVFLMQYNTKRRELKEQSNQKNKGIS